jgi:hypothetical protein
VRWKLAAASIVIVGLLGAAAGAAFFTGFVVGRHEFYPSRYLAAAESRIFGRRFEDAATPEGSNFYESTFVNLHFDIATLPRGRRGSGGGLTTFGDDILLVTHDGSLYAARNADDIRALDIAVPDLGVDAYREAAAANNHPDLDDTTGRLRYNDILYYRTEEGHGLALSYTEYHASDACFGNTLAILPVPGATTQATQISSSAPDWTILYRSQPCLPTVHDGEWRAIAGHTAGGRMVFEPATRTIFLTNGDFGFSESTTYDGYSAALRQSASGDWTRERLASFLADPEVFAPGTTMVGAAVGDPVVRDMLIDLLGYRVPDPD